MNDTRTAVTQNEKVMMNKLNDCGDLSAWEHAFLHNLYDSAHLSEAQKTKLNEIHDRRFT